MLQYYREVLETIREAVESLDEVQYQRLLDDCVSCLQRGGKIIASGLGKNVPICEKFVGTMNSVGLDARFLHTNTAIHGDLGMINSRDMVFLLSKGGNTYETVALAQYLRERGTNTWLLCFTDQCKTMEYVENCFIMKLRDEGDPWDIIPNNSTTIYLIILQGIAIELCRRMGVTLDDFRRNHPGGGIGARLRGEDLWKSER